MSKTARIFTIAPELPFADALAAGLAARYGETPESLAAVTVLLPTRRAARALTAAFLRLSGGKPLLLPAMTPLGDVDEDELAFGLDGELPGAGEEVPPAISGLRRQLLLARLVRGFDKTLSADQAARLAGELARLIDRVQTEGLDFAGLAELVPALYAEHWQKTLAFLEIVTRAWPAILDDAGAIDPARRRNLLLGALAARWRDAPPAHAVIAAGSTGTIPATASLLKRITELPEGAVVLPGLDRDLAGDADLAESHPQAAMRRLLATLGVEAAEVADWPAPGVTGAARARARLIADALCPAEASDAWRTQEPPPKKATAGLQLVECADEGEEAGTIALMMREALEEAGKTASLVTPDRGLARRVAAELGRWGIEIDDSAGVPLARTPPGAYLRLAAAAAAEDFAPVALLALAKHPLAAGGRAPGDFRAAVRRFETLVLRGPRPAPGIGGLRDALAAKRESKEVRARFKALDAWLDDLDAAAAPFAGALAAGGDFAEILAAHVGFAEALAASDAAAGPERLWARDDGEAAAGFVAELLAEAAAIGAVAGPAYPALFEALMEGRVVRPAFGAHPRLAIWGLLEARLQSADLVILGGLNEGTWPPEAEVDPWMSRPMRADFGLPSPERRIGLTAHDFQQAFSAPNVALTRARRVDGTPQVASRWLLRLQRLLRGHAAEAAILVPGPAPAWHALLDAPEAVVSLPAPAPAPPLEARPRRLSVTRIETWMRDPYGIYAEFILGLKAFAEIDAAPGAADYGTLIHHALDTFIRETEAAPAADPLARLREIGREVFAEVLALPSVWAFWWPRFERIAAWFAGEDAARRAAGVAVVPEAKGEIALSGPGGKFTLSAVADRIERLSDGTLVIADYKTGALPSKREIETGFAPQLPLEAVIAEKGGFAGVAASPVSGLAFWRLKGGDPAGEIEAYKVETAAAAKAAEANLMALIETFDDPKTPYLARPRPDAAPKYSDYEHLARVKEWAHAGEDGE